MTHPEACTTDGLGISQLNEVDLSAFMGNEDRVYPFWKSFSATWQYIVRKILLFLLPAYPIE